jgi:hypothetical protein
MPFLHKVSKSRPRQWADGSGPFYKTIHKPASNPAHGSGRIFQVQLLSKDLNNPPTAVGGIQIRDFDVSIDKDLNNLPTAVGRIPRCSILPDHIYAPYTLQPRQTFAGFCALLCPFAVLNGAILRRLKNACKSFVSVIHKELPTVP